jgi:hypothetical protein
VALFPGGEPFQFLAEDPESLGVLPDGDAFAPRPLPLTLRVREEDGGAAV